MSDEERLKRDNEYKSQWQQKLGNLCARLIIDRSVDGTWLWSDMHSEKLCCSTSRTAGRHNRRSNQQQRGKSRRSRRESVSVRETTFSTSSTKCSDDSSSVSQTPINSLSTVCRNDSSYSLHTLVQQPSRRTEALPEPLTRLELAPPPPPLRVHDYHWQDCSVAYDYSIRSIPWDPHEQTKRCGSIRSLYNLLDSIKQDDQWTQQYNDLDKKSDFLADGRRGQTKTLIRDEIHPQVILFAQNLSLVQTMRL
ncbi:hypothetical protein ACOME3_007392 [Neoechinorhynchus agilis]